MYPISIPKCLSDGTQYIRIEIGCSVKYIFLQRSYRFPRLCIFDLYCQELVWLDPIWHIEIRYLICIVYSFTDWGYAAQSKCHIGVSPSSQKIGHWDLSQSHVQVVSGIVPNHCELNLWDKSQNFIIFDSGINPRTNKTKI